MLDIEIEQRAFPFRSEGGLDLINRGLENFLLSSGPTQGQVPFEQLPRTIMSGGIDLYASWLSELHSSDPEGRERYAEIGVMQYPEALFYQPNPLVAWYGIAMAIPYDFPRNIIGKIDIHTHRGLSTFSTTDVDRVPGRRAIKASIVANPYVNYLILPTTDTLSEPDGVDYTRSSQYRQLKSFPPITRFIEKFIGRTPSPNEADDVIRLLRTDGKEETYVGSYFYLQYMANLHKLGIYYSKRDGLFVRINDSIQEHIQECIERAIKEKIVFPSGS